MAYDFAEDRAVPRSRTDKTTLELRAERLEVEKTEVPSGTASLRKEVIAQLKTLEIPVLHEELTIQRRQPHAAPAKSAIGESYVLRVTLSAEKCSVRLNTVVAEQVTIGKRHVVETQHVSESLTHEELEIEETAVPPIGTDR